MCEECCKLFTAAAAMQVVRTAGAEGGRGGYRGGGGGGSSTHGSARATLAVWPRAVEAHDLGQPVRVPGVGDGCLAYVGDVHFATGGDAWCGVVLDHAHGDNDGAVDGVRYFRCTGLRGTFAPVQGHGQGQKKGKGAVQLLTSCPHTPNLGKQSIRVCTTCCVDIDLLCDARQLQVIMSPPFSNWC